MPLNKETKLNPTQSCNNHQIPINVYRLFVFANTMWKKNLTKQLQSKRRYERTMNTKDSWRKITETSWKAIKINQSRENKLYLRKNMNYTFMNRIFKPVFVCLFAFKGISTFIGYLMPNQLSYK